MQQRGRVLVVDDHEEMVRLIAEELGEAGFEVVGATNADAAMAAVRDQPVDVAVTDLHLGPSRALDLLDHLHSLDPHLPIVVVTAFGTIDGAVDAMRRGAVGYVTKPFRAGEIALQVARALGQRPAAAQSARPGVVPAGLVGTSPAMQSVYSAVAKFADTDGTVLIRGESGTGKELIARALHQGSRRREAPFVAVNCASIPATLLESELFGHVRGSFTGATGPRRGLFLAAEGGTLFLDEIGDMPHELQAHLLRVLEDRSVRPVGADVGRPVDVRVITATHQDLEARVSEGRFRADLFYRLDVLPIRLPPLRSRVEDIPELFDAFLARCGPTAVERLAPDTLSAFERYAWPGNVRELENLVRRLSILVDHAIVRRDDLRLHANHVLVPKKSEPTPLERARATLPTLRQLETEYIQWVSEQCAGNKTRAAELLGIDVSTIHRRLRGERSVE